MRPGAVLMFTFFFFFNDTATTEIYTLSLHDALPISFGCRVHDSYGSAEMVALVTECDRGRLHVSPEVDRKSTRLNSSHGYISYAVFCLKKKKKANITARDYLGDRPARDPLIEFRLRE